MSLAGRRALVTGGGTGLGRALAWAFAAQGAEVVVAGRRPEPLEAVAAELPGTRAIAADVTDPASVAALFAAAGRCDVVVANAGMAESAPFSRTSLDLWRRMMEVNLLGTVLTFREGLARMEGWGRLIAVSSVAGLRGHPYVTAYAASKHAVVGLVRSLALEVARKGITANALCPGFLDTAMTDRSVEAIVARTGRSPEEARAAIEALSPQGRLIRPEEVAAAALWLCGPGSDAVNGQAVALDGGAG